MLILRQFSGFELCPGKDISRGGLGAYPPDALIPKQVVSVFQKRGLVSAAADSRESIAATDYWIICWEREI